MKNMLIVAALVLASLSSAQDLSFYTMGKTDFRGTHSTESGVSFSRNLKGKFGVNSRLGLVQDSSGYWQANEFNISTGVFYQTQGLDIFTNGMTDFRGNYAQEVGLGYTLYRDSKSSLRLSTAYRLNYPYAGYSNRFSTELTYSRPLN